MTEDFPDFKLKNMDNKPDIKMNTEDILNSLEGIHRAEPRPFFYTRLMTNLHTAVAGWDKLVAVISRPAFAIATVVLFFLINIVILYSSSSRATSSSQNESSLAIENDYELSVPSLYDINPEQNDIVQK